jgi:hypothetical protein
VVANIESAYLRDYGLTLDLSEQFAYHTTKTTAFRARSSSNLTETESSYWNGDWIGRVAETMKIYSLPREPEAPYRNLQQLAERMSFLLGADAKLLGAPNYVESTSTGNQDLIDKFEYDEVNIPAASRARAIYRITDYTSFDGKAGNTKLIESFLRTNRPISIGVSLAWKWDPATGVYQHDPANTKPGGHAMLIIGFAHVGADNTKNYFILKNSWGGKDFYLVSYDFIAKNAHAATVMESVSDPAAGAPWSTRWLGHWNVDNDGWRGRMLIRRYNSNGKGFRMGNFFADDGSQKAVLAKALDNGRTVEYHLEDQINGSSTKLSGQAFSLSQYTGSAITQRASGYTTWNKTQYGLQASRDPLMVINGANAVVTDTLALDGWLGTWAVTVDGVVGHAHFDQVSGKNKDQLTGTFETFKGAPLPLVATSPAGTPHLIDASYDKKKIRLMRFTREPGRAAGFTTTSKVHYGVHASHMSVP